MNKELVSNIESLEWVVDKEEHNLYRIGKFSPAGQDFSIVIKGEDTEELVNSIYLAYKNYDVSEETYLWLDNTGHGTNGAPYEMKDILRDMEACEQMILDLYNELSN